MSVFVDISTDDPTKIKINAPFRYKDLIKGLPGSSYKKEKWTVPLSWQACLALRGTFRENLMIGPDLIKWASEYRSDRIDPALTLRDQVSADLEGYDNLYPHQRAGVLFLSTAKRALLCDGLGSGKTYTAFSTVKFLDEQGENTFPLLVVCPNSTKLGWEREIKAMMPDVPVTVINGSSVQRKKQFKKFDEIGGVLVINWESLKSHSRIAPYGSHAIKKCVECGGADPKIKDTACQAHEKELNLIDFKAVIADEAHKAKSASALQTRALKAATGDAEYRFALTGTPLANAPDDLFSILNWLYPQAYPSKTKFIDRFLSVSYNNWGAATVIGVRPEMQPEFFAGLDPILRRMPKEVILPFLPPVVYQRRDVEMSPKQAKAYKQMKEQMIADLDGDLLITTSPLTQMTRLLQFSFAFGEVELVDVKNPDTGAMEKRQKLTLSDPSATLDAFMDDIEGFDGEPVVVFAASKQLVNLLGARLEKAKIPYGRVTGDEDSYERQRHMDNFQGGHTQFILCTSAGSAGITLTRAKTMVLLGRPWSNIDFEQSLGRIHRIGSEVHDVVTYIDYVTKDTVQEVVFEALGEKSHQLQAILRDKDLMRKVIEENTLANVEIDSAPETWYDEGIDTEEDE